jgi:hypothetical protein
MMTSDNLVINVLFDDDVGGSKHKASNNGAINVKWTERDAEEKDRVVIQSTTSNIGKASTKSHKMACFVVQI